MLSRKGQVTQAQVDQVPRKTVAIPQTQVIDRAVNALLVTQKVQKTVEMLQVQFFDEIVNASVGWMDRCSRFRSADHRADPEG